MHIRMSSWSDYPILLAVAETGSLTAAGRKLSMSQPTVGRRIRALEDHFGTPLLTKEDGQIDWRKSAEDILRLINACNKPYAGAFCEYNGSPLIIWDAELAETEQFVATPGQIASIHDDYVEITTGDGKIRIKEMEYEGAVISPKALFKSSRDRVK